MLLNIDDFLFFEFLLIPKFGFEGVVGQSMLRETRVKSYSLF